MPVANGKGRSRSRIGAGYSHLYEEQRVIRGIHAVYGPIDRAIGLDQILSAKRQTLSHRVLSHTVMARMAHPDSKRSRVRVLARDLGVSIASASP